MNLPIDFTQTHFPIREKYIDEETPDLCRWMVFGEYLDGTVAICDSQGRDIFTHVSHEQAKSIISSRNRWVGELLEQLNGKRAFPGWPPV